MISLRDFDIKIVAAKVANSLTAIDANSQWEVKPYDADWVQHIINVNNPPEQIGIRFDRGKKFIISGHFPDMQGHARTPDNIPLIGCSATKSPDDIAKDIDRRLLNDYRYELSKVIEQGSESQLFQKIRLELATSLSTVMGVEWKPNSHFDVNHGTPVISAYHSKPSLEPVTYRFEAKINSEKSIDIDLQVKDAKLARKIITKIMEMLRAEVEAKPAPTIPDAAYIDAARELYGNTEIEVDEGADVSRGDDPGAFVAGWLWVSDADAREYLSRRNS